MADEEKVTIKAVFPAAKGWRAVDFYIGDESDDGYEVEEIPFWAHVSVEVDGETWEELRPMLPNLDRPMALVPDADDIKGRRMIVGPSVKDAELKVRALARRSGSF